MIYLGIDPGVSGAVASLNVEGNKVSVIAIPFKNMTETDIWNTFYSLKRVDAFALIESVHSMPKQGVVSTFTFGQNYGMLKMALAGNAIPREFITPQAWQKYMRCRSKGNKNVTKAAAQRLFPKIKVTHAIADALLIAEYCRRIRK